MNNNNTYNRYFVAGASDSLPNAGEWFRAEKSFFKNKHDSIGAQRIHIHPARVIRIARSVASGEYRPRPGYCFPLLEPSPREIFAAFCSDRLVHHYVAPFINEIAEAVHSANGNVSHGNRIGHSAQTGAEQIRESISSTGSSIVVKIDFQCFFVSINREKAYKVLEDYANLYYDKPDKEEKLNLCRKLITHDPTIGCMELPARIGWDVVPPRKRMKNARPGCGLPIGNFYSQLIANLFLAVLDGRLKPYGIHPRFVDDKCCIVASMKEVKKVLAVAEEVAGELGLTLHPDKRYIQPAHRGVNFCGRVVKGGRIYLSNRTINRAKWRIRTEEISLDGARRICRSINSILGLMRHCTEWKNERWIALLTLDKFSPWLYFTVRKGHFVCKMKKAFTQRTDHLRSINELTSFYHETWEIQRKRRVCPC